MNNNTSLSIPHEIIMGLYLHKDISKFFNVGSGTNKFHEINSNLAIKETGNLPEYEEDEDGNRIIGKGNAIWNNQQFICTSDNKDSTISNFHDRLDQINSYTVTVSQSPVFKNGRFNYRFKPNADEYNVDTGQVISGTLDCSSLLDNKAGSRRTESDNTYRNAFKYQEGDYMENVSEESNMLGEYRKELMDKLNVKNLIAAVPTAALELSVANFIKNNFLSKYIYKYNCRYVNESLHCACLSNSNDDIHFIHSTNYLFHIIFDKKVKLRMISNIPIREGLDQGVYFKQIDKFTFAIGFIYENIEVARDENLNEIKTPVLYNNIYIVGKNANEYIKDYTRRFIKLESKVSSKINELKNDADNKFNANEAFKSVYIDGVRVKCKSFDDIIMNEDDKAKLKEKIKSFITNRDLYYNHNIKYKLGIILYGEPGTGKTTMIHSIASYISELTFELDKNRSINIQEVSNIKSPGSNDSDDDYNPRKNSYSRSSRFMNAPSNYHINNYDIKIVEEFDTYFEDSTSEENGFKVNKGATKKDVVNFIDKCEDGTIFILSTNHIDRIREFDSALIRPGRIDMFIEMKPFDKEQSIQFANWFNLEDKSFLDELSYPIMPSELEVIIQNKLYNQIDRDLYNN